MAVEDIMASLTNGFLGFLGGSPANPVYDEGQAGEAAVAYATDPAGYMVEEGYDTIETTPEQLTEALSAAMAQVDVSPQVEASLQAYVAGSPAPVGPAADGGGEGALGSPPAAPPAGEAMSLQQLSQQLEYVTTAINQNNPTVINNITEVYDNSQDINLDLEGATIDGDFEFEVETTNVTASGDGAVAAGDDVDNAVTGDGAVLVDGDNSGGIATGDGAFASGEGDTENVVVGDNNQAVQGTEDTNVGFGDGNVTDFGDADIDDSAISIGSSGDTTNVSDVDDAAIALEGDAQNVSDIELEDNAALAIDGDAEVDDSESEVEIEIESEEGDVEAEIEVDG